jgi:hypothetical protein
MENDELPEKAHFKKYNTDNKKRLQISAAFFYFVTQKNIPQRERF